MANWWEAAPLADSVPAGASWWEAAPLAREARPQPATPTQPEYGPAPMSDEDRAAYERELARVRQERSVPHVPGIHEGALGMSAEDEAWAAVESAKAEAARARAQEERTLGDRAIDTAAFVASLPVRMATKGDYGIGDVAQLVGERPEFVDALRRREGSFAENNQAGLEAVQAVGDVTAGIPMLSTMGAVPGQMLRTSAAAARNLPAQVRELAADSSGAMRIGRPMGTPIHDAAGAVSHYVDDVGNVIPPPTAAAPQAASAAPQASPTTGPRPPINAEVIDAAKRIDVPLMRAMVGNRVEQGLAGGLSAVPYAGTPIVNAFERGRTALGDAAARAVRSVGTPGAHTAGDDATNAMARWLKDKSRQHLDDVYGEAGKSMKPEVRRPLQHTRREVEAIRKDMAESTSTTPQPAIDMVQEAINRPDGLTFNGLASLRTDVGARLEAARISPEPGTSTPAMKRLYAALSKDLEGTAARAGGKRGLEAFRTANRNAEEIAGQRRELERIIGPKGDVGEGQVVNRIQSLASTQGSDLNRLRIAKNAMGPQAWGNLAAEIGERMGIDTATGQWSHNRFMTAYGKLSDDGKTELFGAARPMFDDIATVSSKFKELEKLGNHSGTARANAVIQLITNPAAIAGAAVVSPTAALGLGGFAAGRRLAWYLASPPGSRRAGNLIKSYYGVEAALRRGGAVLARNEEALDNSIRSFAAGLAAETGQNAGELERRLRDAIDQIRRQ